MALCTLPEWRDEMEGEERQVEDEFACPGLLTGPLQTIKPTVKRVFEVNLRIGGDENSYTPQDEQVWLQLRGSKRQVEAAKLFIKGIVNQEAQKEVQYPGVLHCVFCGARGLFMDCLVRNTSAHIVVGSLGCLLISGLDEPVVRAYSLVMDLVDRYKYSQERPTAPAESLNSRLAFKSLVQRLEDHHTLELLVLPVLVKEVLLDLVEQSGLDPSNVSGEAGSPGVATRELSDSRIPDVLDRPPVPNGASYTNPPSSPLRHFFPESHNHRIKVHGKSEQVGLEPGEDACNPSHFFRGVIAEGNKEENGRDKWAGVVSLDTEDEQGESQQQDENLLSAGSKQEYEHLLKFFTAMGYDEEVVCRILTRTGPREASQVLDLIQQEQEKNMIEEGSGKSSAAASDREAMHGPEKITENETVNGALGGNAEDFVLGVMKQAAASCGYTEEKVAEVYSSLPALKPHQLIMELQKESTKADEPREDIEGMRTEKPEDQPRKAATPQKTKKKDLKEQKKNEKTDGKSAATNMEKTNQETVGSLKEKPKKKEVQTARRGGRAGPEPIIPGHFSVPGATDWQSGKPEILSSPPNQPTFQTIPSNVRGPPQPIYPSLNQPKFSGQHITTTESLATKPKHKMGHSMARAGAVVTGEQRYLEGIATPFTLQLKDDPGDPGLRQIIIDGSNVAMSHGLGIFFSCRGIALAVQYFWSRGHRKITVFVPQWRQKRDPRIKEQQFMSQLQDLGLLSFTPSREVMGKRINSYDDRFMLQLAQQTDGVIVTNDNLRDLVEESAKWREIVKNRLLQYVFAGDLFMVPDDPLGRGGPHIDHFLRKQNSQPVPRSHSFAGVASSFPPPSSHPRAQTEVLQYRDLTTGGRDFGRDRALGRIPAQTNKNVTRTVDETMKLKQELVQIFPGQESMITMALQCNPNLKDINDLSHFILEQQQEEIEEL